MYSFVVSIIFVSVFTILEVAKYACPTINESAESVILHLTLVIVKIWASVTIFHSLNIAFYKYYIIVMKRPVNKEDNFMEFRYLFALIILPFLWGLAWYVKDKDTIAQTMVGEKMCINEDSVVERYVPIKDVFFCKFKEDISLSNTWHIFSYLSEALCIIQAIVSIINGLNIFEGLVYYKIFSFARK